MDHIENIKKWQEACIKDPAWVMMALNPFMANMVYSSILFNTYYSSIFYPMVLI